MPVKDFPNKAKQHILNFINKCENNKEWNVSFNTMQKEIEAKESRRLERAKRYSPMKRHVFMPMFGGSLIRESI